MPKAAGIPDAAPTTIQVSVETRELVRDLAGRLANDKGRAVSYDEAIRELVRRSAVADAGQGERERT